MKRGIAFTTHNRRTIAADSISRTLALSLGIEFVIVDDGSTEPYPNATFRFETPQGIARAKNKCLELLYNRGCTDTFLLDDDIYPVDINWMMPYAVSGLSHACYTFDRAIISRTDKYIEFEKPCGCMLYVKRNVLDIVGGWDTDFIGYGFDHVNWSDRIFNAGLTPARYIDVIGSKFQMAECQSSIPASIRAATIPMNFKLYQERFFSKEFKEFRNG